MKVEPEQLCTRLSEIGLFKNLQDNERKEKINREVQHLINLLSSSEIKSLAESYEYIETLAAGGSGIVFEIKEMVSGCHRAMKLSRSDSKPNSDNLNQHIDVDQEIAAMELTSHEYITRLYAAKKTKENYYCFITELVPAHDTLDQYFIKRISEQSNSNPHLNPDSLLNELAVFAYSISKALQYMHDKCKLCHMDVKPVNILISHTGHPYLTDLGFARPIIEDGASKFEEVYVGFTYAYAHKDLLDSSLRIGETQAKALNCISAKLDQNMICMHLDEHFFIS